MHLKRLMRHESISTTDRFYTDLRLSDQRRELVRQLNLLPAPTGQE